jgi:TolB protein
VSKQQALTGFDVSPDGQTIVFARREVRDGTYVAHLWRVPTAGGRPERLTPRRRLTARPRISPDGSSVLFVSDREGAKKSQPWVLPLGGGEAQRICSSGRCLIGCLVARWPNDRADGGFGRRALFDRRTRG